MEVTKKSKTVTIDDDGTKTTTVETTSGDGETKKSYSVEKSGSASSFTLEKHAGIHHDTGEIQVGYQTGFVR